MRLIEKKITYNALYSKKVDIKACKKIDRIVKQLGVPKWRVINSLISEVLNVKTDDALNLEKWTKK